MDGWMERQAGRQIDRYIDRQIETDRIKQVERKRRHKQHMPRVTRDRLE
jgi:hypothetical protein